jgi:N-acetylmuramoyl-L-alanine amidase
VIGASAEGTETLFRTGAITIIPGTTAGLTSRDAKTIHQDEIPLNLEVSHADHWGDALAHVDVNGDGKSELLVASSSKSIGTQFDSGIITLFWGTNQGIIPQSVMYLDQNITGIPDDNKSMDYWGRLGTSSELTLERPPLALTTLSGVNVVVMAELPQISNDSLPQYIVRTPCGRAERAFGGELMKNIQIVIDPGHGGIDGGAGYFGLREHSVNLTVSEALQNELTSRGITSFLVRSSNYHIPLASRGLYADHLQADAMISIHHNAPTIAPSRHPGTEAFVQSNSNNSARLGTLVYESVYEALDKFSWISWTSQYDAGVIRVLNNRGTDTYGMLSRPRTPTTLVELAYLANRAEANLIKSPDYLPAVSVAMANAVEEYLNSPIEKEYSSSVRNFTAADAPGYSVCRDPDLGSPLMFEFAEGAVEKALLANE